jgi:soluble lytic murein transglycosylase
MRLAPSRVAPILAVLATAFPVMTVPALAQTPRAPVPASTPNAIPTPIPAGDPMAAVRADRWADAAAAAASFADPVGQKLVTWFRLSAPNAAGAAEIAAFMTQNPDWPNQALLEKRRQEALVTEPDPAVLAAECARSPLTVTAAQLRCADILPGEAGLQAARAAWTGTGIVDPAAETQFLARFGGTIRPQDQRARFDALAWTDPAAAARQIGRLDPADRPAAEARLAFRRDDPAAPAMYAALSPAQRDAAPNASGLFLEQARSLRRTDQDAAALALWLAQARKAETAAPADRLGSFWTERMTLARKLLKDGDAAGAAGLAAGHGAGPSEQVADAEFFAGFVKLRRLNDPAGARTHFQTLAGLSKAALTQSRAHYWLGRASAAAGGNATAEYEKAGAWPTTFYGQLALMELNQDPAPRIRAQRDLGATRDQVLNFTDREVVRAAVLLVAWGDARRAHAFILRMDELAPDAADRALNARLAMALGMPDMAVFVARRMGRDGLMLPDAGWPMPFAPPEGTVDPALALGVMRQESSFDIAAISPSGARGLMQLMPATAQQVSSRIGEPTSLVALTADPSHNMRLGTAYLREMLDRFGGSVPLAVAAYNAGPHRVDQWLIDNGDPRGTGAGRPDMIDWLEQIPIGETRNYVQRVLENTAVYRAKLNEASATRQAQWTN